MCYNSHLVCLHRLKALARFRRDGVISSSRRIGISYLDRECLTANPTGGGYRSFPAAASPRLTNQGLGGRYDKRSGSWMCLGNYSGDENVDGERRRVRIELHSATEEADAAVIREDLLWHHREGSAERIAKYTKSG